MMIKTVDECKKILELAIGEVDHVIPADVLEATIYYLEDYEKVKSKLGWIKYPERMGN